MAKPVPSVSHRDAAATPFIVAGIGCRRGVAAAEIITLLEHALTAANQSAASLVAIASLDRKADEPGLLAAAAAFGVPLRTFSAAELNASGVSGSHKIQALIGTASVAEAAALRAGPLVAPKLKSAWATCALAVADPGFGHAVGGKVPASTASMAASRSLTSNAGP